ncbi:MAG: hypothetical protein O3A46_05150 [Candidatus Poribacteria bacterium]|nr:hypothetical protein [Candidatus Poribacteria bacterium]
MDATINGWIESARAKLGNGGIKADDLDALQQLLRSGEKRQRLLYLHTTSLSPRSGVIATTFHEPVEGWVAEIDPEATAHPYGNVQAAIRDGWRVIHFPDQRAPFEDGEIDILGYEFILEKWEEIDDR